MSKIPKPTGSQTVNLAAFRCSAAGESFAVTHEPTECQRVRARYKDSANISRSAVMDVENLGSIEPFDGMPLKHRFGNDSIRAVSARLPM
jgi:hypothetical protein